MATSVFINLPVNNLELAKAFFTKLGWSFNPDFTDETAACMVISDTIFAMLLTHEKFAQFTPRPIADAHKVSEMLIALNRDSQTEVDALVDKATAAGGSEPRALQDLGFMYSRAFADLDGHIWEIFWMDPAAIPQTE
ncbi:VOC family protein [Devosia rhodophyticola]|uniref:VOC family protein n=1 Tax=Devosia rhodophyticola TaxID=3026423 RepID=A0ABY7Z135_9HYPH|nr:VOC family protein [Devosia rhodophyticola]WDR07353.1 VOC family protein [Devosia rhodophyticola]